MLFENVIDFNIHKKNKKNWMFFKILTMEWLCISAYDGTKTVSNFVFVIKKINIIPTCFDIKINNKKIYETLTFGIYVYERLLLFDLNELAYFTHTTPCIQLATFE